MRTGFPSKQGLYDPAFERDSCGVGFLCDIKGRQSHALVQKALEVLRRLSHRGATGSDPKTGDGAGILLQIPHDFFRKMAEKNKISLPKAGEYASGLIFLPTDRKERDFCKEVFKKSAKSQGLCVLGWRCVPVDNSDIGSAARLSQPEVEQVFIGGSDILSGAEGELDFERRLYVTRRLIENSVSGSNLEQRSFFYITNLSCRTFSYKGLLMPEQLDRFFPDLGDPDIKSAICLVHSRYSTNTFPTWDLAQPFRYLAHNGEINTLRGNINWMRAREKLLKSPFFGKDVDKIKPVIVPGGSDSAAIDNIFELLYLAGRPVHHVMTMLVPSAWEHDKSMDVRLKDFYKYHACLMEPWDGPAAIAFTDGKSVGAVLDRNGLRPARYIVTKDDFVVMASEVGVLDIEGKNIRLSGRLEPGKIFYVDTQKMRIVSDEEIKNDIACRMPYGKWLNEQMVELADLPAKPVKKTKPLSLFRDMIVFGYSREDLKVIIKPMAETAQEPIGSMGNDTPHAVLSSKSQPLYNYFKQLFAQVTNPAIDPIREELVMSLVSYIGPEKNIFEETPEHCRKLRVEYPILTDIELGKIKGIRKKGFKTKVISLLFKAESGGYFKTALEKICTDSVEAIKEGFSFIVLSDRGVNKEMAPIPALLAVGALHHYLVRRNLRKSVAIVVESAEPREVHHFALLLGYGADCVNPYLVYEAVRYLSAEGEVSLDAKEGLKNYVKAVNKGLMKILSKMGISTLQSYRGAQIFEILGLNDDVVGQCFDGTVSRINGAGFSVIAEETLLRHKEAFSREISFSSSLPSGGQYQWKKDGEFHAWNPESISALQDAVRNNDYETYKKFSRLINDQSKNPFALRGLLRFKTAKAVPIEEVEAVEEIIKRFATGAMSFGSISRLAHETLALAMNRMKAKSNTGEGGEDPTRFVPLPNGDSLRSAIKQVASGRFGVTTNYLVNADEIQIKIAQGAKPGEGGQLPGHKVSSIIARTRYTTEGVTLISPPPHHDIYSIEDLAQLIFDLKNVNPRARISVKLVSESGVGTVAVGVAKGHADMILISGGDGGTGASPLSSIKHAGLPWELGLAETHQALLLNDLRGRVRLQTDGQIRTGRDVAIAALLGAEEFGFSTSALIAVGCVMLRHCHLNNCSLGVATQEEVLQKRFRGRPEFIQNYLNFIVRELREIMSELGIRKFDDMVGHPELLEVNTGILPWKAGMLDYSRILYKPEVSGSVQSHFCRPQDHAIDKVLDRKLIELAAPALDSAKPVKVEIGINNTNRSTGAMLSGEICRRRGEGALPEGTFWCRFKGIAGQSFGAFLVQGVTFELEGMANDYVGKGISGGKIIIYPYKGADYKPSANIIVGNTVFYGAISGEAYIRGKAGERFCIRNSGLYTVVEGVGDHGCEYMTGGRVVILGDTGRNFGAGMSGGIAYVYDPEGRFKDRCNMEMISFEPLEADDQELIQEMLRKHHLYTGSISAKAVWSGFQKEKRRFVKVMPLEYKRILSAKKQEIKMGLADEGDG